MIPCALAWNRHSLQRTASQGPLIFRLFPLMSHLMPPSRPSLLNNAIITYVYSLLNDSWILLIQMITATTIRFHSFISNIKAIPWAAWDDVILDDWTLVLVNVKRIFQIVVWFCSQRRQWLDLLLEIDEALVTYIRSRMGICSILHIILNIARLFLPHFNCIHITAVKLNIYIEFIDVVASQFFCVILLGCLNFWVVYS